MRSAMAVSDFFHDEYCVHIGNIVDEPTAAQESSSSSAIILRDQDGTVSTLRDSAAGML